MSFFEYVNEKSGKKVDLLNVAHRGARSLAPENTLESAKAALKAKAHLWEVDVRLTKDKKLVVIHDMSLKRISNAALLFPEKEPWNVQDFTLSELKELDFGFWFVEQDPYEQIFQGQVENIHKFKGLSVLTLEEALFFTKEHDWFINVELKDLSDLDDHGDFPLKIAAKIKDMQLSQQVLISSFNLTYLSKIKKYQNNLTTGALINALNNDPLTLLRDIKADALHPHWTLVNEGLLKKIKHTGYKVMVWTVNDGEIMKNMISLGVNGLITDFPQRLTSLLTDKNSN